MGKCFVVQPFDDGGPFDKRYNDIIEPAIRAADLDPDRVDRDPSVSIPIDDIEAKIRNADICLLDITEDNPNVWFELGYAIAMKKIVVLICSDKRTSHFPFDVQHRKITKYKTDSPSDFEKLQNEITERIKGTIASREKISSLSAQTSIADIEGLSQYELTALVTVAENSEPPQNWISAYKIMEEMTSVGFTRIAVNIALSKLLKKNFLKLGEEQDNWGEPFNTYVITDKGMSWLIDNSDKLVLKREKEEQQDPFLSELDDDEIPF